MLDEMYRNLSRLRRIGFDGMKGAIWKDCGTRIGRNNDQGPRIHECSRVDSLFLLNGLIIQVIIKAKISPAFSNIFQILVV